MDIKLKNKFLELWKKYFKENSIDALLAEHVWEHLSKKEGIRAAKICFKYLKNKTGYIRVAVPDGLFPSKAYINHVKPKGNDSDAYDHKILYTYKSLSRIFEKVGFKVSNKLWIETVLTAGNIFNYSEGSAFIVYNNTDVIKYKAGFNLISPVSKRVELSIRYLLSSQNYDETLINTSSTITTKTNNFIIHKLIGGIKWTF